MKIAASSLCVKLIEGKGVGDHQKQHVKYVESQLMAVIGWIKKPSNGSIETSGGIENGVGDSV